MAACGQKLNQTKMKTKEEQIEMITKDIKEFISVMINETTSRTVEISTAGYQCNLWNQILSDDEDNKELQQWIEDNYQYILEDMVFNDKEFIFQGKIRGNAVTHIQKNNVTGNKITIKYVNQKENGTVWVQFKQTITRK